MKNCWVYVLLLCFERCRCVSQKGPDPWNYDTSELPVQLSDDVPPDLRQIPKKYVNTENNVGISDWFFKRMLVIVLKGGQVKENEDETIDVSLQMKFDQKRWSLLNQYITTDKQFTEDIFRRTIGYIEDSIYKPTIAEKVVMAWNEYIQIYLTEYKFEITWVLTAVTIKVSLIWMMKRMSHKHMIIILFLFLYLYEVFISYKEAEKQDMERFLSAIDACSWKFWSSSCEVPPPDPLIFLRHMNPLKVGIRMFTTLISEPILIISDTVKTITHGITDGLWFPLDKLMFGVLIVVFNVLLIFLFIMIIFNYVLNIPFNLSFLGLINIGMKQRNRSYVNTNDHSTKMENGDRISGPRLERLLDICSQALSPQTSQNGTKKLPLTFRNTSIRRSASTGRLPHLENELYANNNRLSLEDTFGKSNIMRREYGSGDA